MAERLRWCLVLVLSDALAPMYAINSNYICLYACLSVCLSVGTPQQESTSEDVNFFYAMTMWAMATGNSRLEGLGRIQTGIVSRSINAYFLMKDSNTNHPADFIRNKVNPRK